MILLKCDIVQAGLRDRKERLGSSFYYRNLSLKPLDYEFDKDYWTLRVKQRDL